MRFLQKICLMSSVLLVSCSTPTVPHSGQSAPTTENPMKKEDIVLTWAVATGIDEEQKKVIEQFNSADNGYKVEVKYYADSLDEEERNMADFRLIQDIINTDRIDIVCDGSFNNPAKMEILENKGAFAELYQFMENDKEVNRETLNAHILSLSEKNGGLYHLPMNYWVETLKSETKYVGDKQNWTFDEFVSAWEKMPENSTINYSRASMTVYGYTLRNYIEFFVDYENASVNFDCDEFREMLEFCNRFEYETVKTDPEWNTPNFVSPCTIGGFVIAADYFDDENTYTMVGFPSADGRGAYFSTNDFAVSAKTPEKQQGAWEFIRLFAGEEYQSDSYIKYDEEFFYPINNAVFEQKMQDVLNGMYQPDYYYDYDGNKLPPKVPTRSECDRLVKYLDSVDRIEKTIDRSLWNIVNEEVMAYLSGEKSIDECIDTIQNRCSIWISEQS